MCAFYNTPSWQQEGGVNCFCKFFLSSSACEHAKSEALDPAATNYMKTIQRTVWMCEYSEDIFQSLLEAEKRRLQISFRSIQQCSRPSLVDFMKTAAVKNSLSRITLHLGVYLLDGFMDTYTIQTNKLNLMALTCLIIASKIEETDAKIPKFSQLSTLITNAHSISEFKLIERKILRTFNFDLICPTVATFAEYYANRCITFDEFEKHKQDRKFPNNEFHTQIENISFEQLLTTAGCCLFDLVDLAINNVRLHNTKPSIIAAACVAAVRKHFQISPCWTENLAQFTEHSEKSISPFVEALLSVLKNSKSCQTPVSSARRKLHEGVICDSPDSGILSDAKCDSDDESDVSQCYPVPVKRRRM